MCVLSVSLSRESIHDVRVRQCLDLIVQRWREITITEKSHDNNSSGIEGFMFFRSSLHRH